MPFEEEYLRKKKLKQAEGEESSVVPGFELDEEEVDRISALLDKMQEQKKISFEQYKNIMPDLQKLFYKIKDKKITDNWIKTINNFKDQDIATAILMGIEKYQYKEVA